MEIKKSKNVELESHKKTWFLMGVIVVLAFMFIAFEWTEYDKKMDASALAQDPIFESTLVPITFPEVKPPPPPKPLPQTAEILDIVEGPEEVADFIMDTPEELGGLVDIGTYKPIIEDEEEVIESTPLDFAEVMPEFPGGSAALMEYLAKNMKYPIISQENNIQGKVIIQFVVDRDGGITNPQVVRSVDPHLDKEALRVINTMPKWTPGYQRGSAVRVKYTVPVIFRLK